MTSAKSEGLGEAGETAWLVKRLGEKEGPKQVKDGHIAQGTCAVRDGMCSDAACLGVPLLQQPLRYRSREDRRTQGLELLGWKDGKQGEDSKGVR